MKKLLIGLTIFSISAVHASNDVSMRYECELKKGNKTVSFSSAKKYLEETEDISATYIENKLNIFSKVKFSFFVLRSPGASGGYMVGVKNLKRNDSIEDIDLAKTGHLVSIDSLDKKVEFDIKKNWTYTCDFSNINY